MLVNAHCFGFYSSFRYSLVQSEKAGLPTSGWWRAPAASGGVSVSGGLVHEWGKDEMGDWKTVNGNAVDVPVCRGEEGAELQGGALDLPVNLCSYTHLTKGQDPGYRRPKWAFSARCLGAFLEIGWGARSLGRSSRVETLLLDIERSQLRWLGHLFRMPSWRVPPGGVPGENPGHAGGTMSRLGVLQLFRGDTEARLSLMCDMCVCVYVCASGRLCLDCRPRDPAPDKREKMDRLVHHLSGDFLMALISCDLIDLLCLLRPAGWCFLRNITWAVNGCGQYRSVQYSVRHEEMPDWLMLINGLHAILGTIDGDNG